MVAKEFVELFVERRPAREALEGRTKVSTTILMTYPSSVKQGGGISGVILAQQAWCPAGGATCAMAVEA